MVWVVLSWTDSIIKGSGFIEELVSPLTQQAVVRLSAIVVVLVATLAIQTLYSRRLRAEQQLRREQARVRQMYDQSPDAILTIDRDHRVLYANSQAESLAADPATGIVGETCHHTLFERDTPCADCPVESVFLTGDVAERIVADRVNGTDRWLEQVYFPVLDDEGDVHSVVESTRDTTTVHLAQKTIQRMAYYDPLTDLPNRALFRDRLATALAQARRRDEIVAVIYVDLDEFKAINDLLGHAVGDGVLQSVARRLRELVREEDTVARQGGDEFTIIARVLNREAAGSIAKRIIESIDREFIVDGHQLRIGASVGIATYPADGVRGVDLIRNADAAMYRAKDWGHNLFRLYTPDMSESSAASLEFEAGLRQAIERDEFELFYQPQIDVRDGHFVGIEALLRWNHPDRGLLAPGEFIDLAEQAGFIGEIGRWVLANACEQASLWAAEGLEFGRIAVNLSAREFVDRDLVVNVARTLQAMGLDPSQLELEITETTAMYDVEQILAILELLRDIGVRVAIDDFGTGYSSLSYLQRFPVQTLKIAQDFMRGVGVDAHSAAIAAMLIELCHELKLDIVAEGVETDAQLEFLRDRGCYVIQGYILSRPVPSTEIAAMLRDGGHAWQALAHGYSALPTAPSGEAQ